MADLPERILLVFVDGVGIGADDARTNPFVTAHLPHLRDLLGGAVPVRRATHPMECPRGDRAVLVPLDATLGVAGRPQSGTGQTALLTGLNAPAIFGRHFGSWVPTPLREALGRENLLSRAVRAGRNAAFANAYPVDFADSLLRRRPAAPPLAARAAGLLVRGPEQIAEGTAVSSSFTTEGWRERLGTDAVPVVTPEAAGQTLGWIAAGAHLTLFAHYDTDLVGHRRDLAGAVAAIERVDAFLGGLLQTLPNDALLVITSDHGNLEDVTSGHTLNPVPLIAVGPGRVFAAERSRTLTDVAPTLLSLLNVQ